MNNKKIFLSLGSIVTLNDGIINLLIVSRQPVTVIDGTTCYFDYAAVSQITGLTDEKIIFFNNENIEEVIFEGYYGPDEEKIIKSMENWRLNTDIIKGEIKLSK
ncbi:DUF4176 domain-containing protein [Streptococcus uberis]|uniref:DUF4176 domain-containing protein n=1 Tax=Streptococcus uberis TaxID=1349 RepID=UPI001FF53BC1|nr:DUF4176 domain-containing protein [Streptococcus uberis]MCK1189278.1 DUF4176 domain-containing protein [Streptococcus uberis]